MIRGPAYVYISLMKHKISSKILWKDLKQIIGGLSRWKAEKPYRIRKNLRGDVPYNWQTCTVSWNRWKIEVKELQLQRMSPTPKRQFLLKFSILKQTWEELIIMPLGKLGMFSDTRLCYCHYWHSSFIRPFWNFQKLSSSWKWYFQVNILLKKVPELWAQTVSDIWLSICFYCFGRDAPDVSETGCFLPWQAWVPNALPLVLNKRLPNVVRSIHFIRTVAAESLFVRIFHP